MLQILKHYLGIEHSGTSVHEKIIATAGGVLGISITYLITFLSTDNLGAAVIVPSMGASAVLLFAVPHGALSQPWALFGGHLISAFVGVACFLLVPNIYIAAGLAVGIAIGMMHMFNCIHPPGGATALAAVIGGEAIHRLGFMYMLEPIFINVVVIFFIAVTFNSFFPWRRYPASMMQFIEKKKPKESAERAPVETKHIEAAIRDMDIVVDVTTDDLSRLFTLALDHADADRLHPSDIILGHFYTNGKHGTAWSVRQIIDEAPHKDPENDLVIYRCTEGAHYGRSNSCTRAEFARWAAREVVKKNGD